MATAKIFILCFASFALINVFAQITSQNQLLNHKKCQDTTSNPCSAPSFDVIIPIKVTETGVFLSHDLTHTHPYSKDEIRKRNKRGIDQINNNNSQYQEIYYLINIRGEKYMIQMKPNHLFLAPHAVVERRWKLKSNSSNEEKLSEIGSVSSSISVIGSLPRCHYEGVLINQTWSKVALSTCDGLKGFLKTKEGEYLIEPLKEVNRTKGEPHPHKIYRRDLDSTEFHSNCASENYGDSLQIRKLWESEEKLRKQKSKKIEKKKRKKRSISIERNVEVLVVADKKMIDFYSNEDLNIYILTIMNMVSTIYHDASIGNAINIIIVRIMLLETPQYEEELEISHNADNTLMSFCQWQQMVNPSSEEHPHHHDVAVLLTRHNICSRSNAHCSTLGLAEIAGMCQPYRSCNVNQDTGLQIAYTVAHEIGHNFGMNHDSSSNGCGNMFGASQYVMSPHLATDNIPITWSNCSKSEITKFLDRQWGTCLLDEPHNVEYNFPELPPGAMYDADHQCRLSFGAKARHCEGIESECQTLWCRVENRCITRLEAAAEGTQCGKHKWCYYGKCVNMGEKPTAINGNWGQWSSWNECSRSCGAGVETSKRLCDNPPPSNGGKYCTGDRRRYRICNTKECPDTSVSFRAQQCSDFNNKPFKGKNFTWGPVTIEQYPCQLHCKPDNEFYSVELKDSVIDGTPCKPGTKDVCIHGVCKSVSCDWIIEGTAQEDRCGLCHGDGTQCVTKKGTFNVTFGISYVKIVTIPAEARNIRVEEVTGAPNYLAVKDNSTGKFYLNGNWVIQWSGEYNAAGTMMYYKRENETETLYLPGPIKRPLILFLLFQTKNNGVNWEYTLPRENVTYVPEFHWEYSDWSVCTSTCGGGVQKSKAQCMEMESGRVEDKYCEKEIRPKEKERKCNNHPCPAWWWSGPWQPCSVTCGKKGKRRRTVICVRSYGTTNQMALMDSDCSSSLKPKEVDDCPGLLSCPPDNSWKVGSWNKKCKGDPCEYERREVRCEALDKSCDPLSKPSEFRQCGNITCGRWDVGEWGQCSTKCGEGVKLRRVECVGGIACALSKEPDSVMECVVKPCLSKNEEETVVETFVLESMSKILPKTQPRIENNSSRRNTKDKKPLNNTVIINKQSNDSKKKKTNVTMSTLRVRKQTDGEFHNDTIDIKGEDPFEILNTQGSFNESENKASTDDLNNAEINETLSSTSEREIPKINSTLGINRSVETNHSNGESIDNDSVKKEKNEEEKEEEEKIDVNENGNAASFDQYKENNTKEIFKNLTENFENITINNDYSLPEVPHVADAYYDFDHQESEAIKIKKDKEIIYDNNSNSTNKVEEGLQENKIENRINNSLNIESEKTEIEIENNNETIMEKENNTSHLNVSNTINNHNESINQMDIINTSQAVNTNNYNDSIDDAYYYDYDDYTKDENNSDYFESNISVNSSDDERPSGIAEDKIDVEDVQLIEIKLKNNKKERKHRHKFNEKQIIKQVKIHTGNDAIRLLNKIAQKANSNYKPTDIPLKPSEKENDPFTPTHKWVVGNWSECTEKCGGGIQYRSIECYNYETLAPPEKCSSVPVSNMRSCNEFQCLNWTISAFGPCSSSCGPGLRVRNATCPQEEKCLERDIPPLQEECFNEPCVQWVDGPWSMCTKSCDGGFQIRFVKCVDLRSQEESNGCSEEKPLQRRPCNNNACQEKQQEQQNDCKDNVDTKLCKRLVHLCSAKFFRLKCCKTCHRWKM